MGHRVPPLGGGSYPWALSETVDAGDTLIGSTNGSAQACGQPSRMPARPTDIASEVRVRPAFGSYPHRDAVFQEGLVRPLRKITAGWMVPDPLLHMEEQGLEDWLDWCVPYVVHQLSGNVYFGMVSRAAMNRGTGFQEAKQLIAENICERAWRERRAARRRRRDWYLRLQEANPRALLGEIRRQRHHQIEMQSWMDRAAGGQTGEMHPGDERADPPVEAAGPAIPPSLPVQTAAAARVLRRLGRPRRGGPLVIVSPRHGLKARPPLGPRTRRLDPRRSGVLSRPIPMPGAPSRTCANGSLCRALRRHMRGASRRPDWRIPRPSAGPPAGPAREGSALLSAQPSARGNMTWLRAEAP